MRIAKWSALFAISIINTGCAPSQNSAEDTGEDEIAESADAASRSTVTRSTSPRRRRDTRSAPGALTSGSTGGSTGQAWLISDYKSNYNPDFSQLFDELQRKGMKWTGDRVAISSEDISDTKNLFERLRPMDTKLQYRVSTRVPPNSCSGAERRVYVVPHGGQEYVFVVDVVFEGAISFADEIRKLEGGTRTYDVGGINMDLNIENTPAVIVPGLGDAVKQIAGECKLRAVRVGRAYDPSWRWHRPSKAFTTFHVPN